MLLALCKRVSPSLVSFLCSYEPRETNIKSCSHLETACNPSWRTSSRRRACWHRLARWRGFSANCWRCWRRCHRRSKCANCWFVSVDPTTTLLATQTHPGWEGTSAMTGKAPWSYLKGEVRRRRQKEGRQSKYTGFVELRSVTNWKEESETNLTGRGRFELIGCAGKTRY